MRRSRSGRSSACSGCNVAIGGTDAPVTGAREPPRLRFRLDIQILRAIAVLMVLGFHLGVAGFGNGFVGVDVFFVVSGYLMFLLDRPEEAAVALSLRRARRLLPVYFATVAATLAPCFRLVRPDGFGQAAEQGAWAAGFASNIGFWKIGREHV